MSCEQIQSKLSLYLYGELPPGETEVLEEHVESCASCSEVLAEERSFFATMNARASAEVSHSLLAECRHDLMRQVYRTDPEPTAPWGRLAGWLPVGRAVFPWQTGLVATSLAMAFFIGRATQPGARDGLRPHPGPEIKGSSVAFQPEAALSGIESVGFDPQGRQVEIVVEEISRRTIRGRPNDPEIHGLLLSTVRYAPSSGVRLDSLDVLTAQAEDREVRRTLLGSMLNDDNPGVRLKALAALRPHRADPEIRTALIEVLRSDSNPGMRVDAIDMLIERPDRDLAGVLQELVETEGNEYVRLRSMRTLQELNASIDRF